MLVVRDFNYLSMEISILEDAVIVVGNNCHPVLSGQLGCLDMHAGLGIAGMRDIGSVPVIYPGC